MVWCKNIKVSPIVKINQKGKIWFSHTYFEADYQST